MTTSEGIKNPADDSRLPLEELEFTYEGGGSLGELNGKSSSLREYTGTVDSSSSENSPVGLV